MKVQLWGELGFYGPGRQGRFEVTLREELPLLDKSGVAAQLLDRIEKLRGRR